MSKTAVFNSQGNVAQYARKNLLINGDFSVWQRDTSGGSSQHMADRWYINTGSWAQGITAAGKKYLSITGTFTEHGVELTTAGENAPFEVGTTITISIQGVFPVAQEVRLYTIFRDSTGSPTNDVIDLNNVLIGTGTGALETYTITHTVGVTAAATSQMYQINLSTPGSPSYDLYNAQMEFGDTATDFEYVMPADQLARCQRYYQSQVQTMAIYSGDVTAGGSYYGPFVPFPVTMRAVPTLTVVTQDGSSSFSGVQTTINRLQRDGMRGSVVAAGTGNGQYHQFQYTVDAEL